MRVQRVADPATAGLTKSKTKETLLRKNETLYLTLDSSTLTGGCGVTE